jgi:hypothetical protein
MQAIAPIGQRLNDYPQRQRCGFFVFRHASFFTP